MSSLRQILKEELARKGQISFARFMELALYCPNFGYYEQKDVSPGRKGDFFTSVSVGDLFGQLLAAQFAEWRVKSAEWQILEAGAHDGRLAADILGWLRTNRGELFGALQYWILEPSPMRRKMQEETLAEFAESVRWFNSWSALPSTGINGVIFSNELLDAMPGHRLGWDAMKKAWFEWGVTLAGDAFVWTKMVTPEIPHSALRTPHSELEAVLPDGFTTEVCPSAIDWWRNAAKTLKSGRLLTLDYGLTAEQFFTPERHDGTLRAYHQHRQSNDLLARPGEQDLTAQVNFTAIREAGESEGLKTESWSSQAQFLVGIMERTLAANPASIEWTPARVRQFQTLTHPEHLGHLFRVLVQTR